MFSTPRPQLKFYRRFIDGLLFIWEGSEKSAVEFLGYLNNMNNIVLDYQIIDKTVNVLDVTFEKTLSKISTTVYFKPTDRNSYLSIRSGHPPAWIKNIPKGQMLRVRCNCTEQDDYYRQANIRKDKFVQKGYRENAINQII